MIKRALFVMPALGFGLAALVGCSATTPVAAPASSVTSTSSATSSSAAAPTSSSAAVERPQAEVEKRDCVINPADAPVPPADPYTTLSAKYGVQVKIAGAPDVVTVGKPVEVEVTLCNNSPVAYPEVGVVFGVARCSCAGEPLYIPRATAQRFDTAGGSWIDLAHPAVGTGMDYISLFSDRQPLPKGKTVTVRYRFTLDQSLGEGKGGILAAAVMTNGPTRISEVSASFAVRH